MIKKTQFSNKVIKEYLMECIKSVPGVAEITNEQDISIDNNVITIALVCLPGVRVFEVCSMVQRTLYYGLQEQDMQRKYKINISIISKNESANKDR